jgi:hypothetical protein
MTICRGVVKDNIVVLEDGAHLSDGAEVEVRLLKPSFPRDEAFARVLANRIMHYVGMDQIIEEDKQEREEHPDTCSRICFSRSSGCFNILLLSFAFVMEVTR